MIAPVPAHAAYPVVSGSDTHGGPPPYARPPYEYGPVPKVDAAATSRGDGIAASCRKVWAAHLANAEAVVRLGRRKRRGGLSGRDLRRLQDETRVPAGGERASSTGSAPAQRRTALLSVRLAAWWPERDVPRPQGFASAGIVSGKGRAQSPLAGLAAAEDASRKGSPHLSCSLWRQNRHLTCVVPLAPTASHMTSLGTARPLSTSDPAPTSSCRRDGCA
jgi:hypothetical protein